MLPSSLFRTKRGWKIRTAALPTTRSRNRVCLHLTALHRYARRISCQSTKTKCPASTLLVTAIMQTLGRLNPTRTTDERAGIMSESCAPSVVSLRSVNQYTTLSLVFSGLPLPSGPSVSLTRILATTKEDREYTTPSSSLSVQ